MPKRISAVDPTAVRVVIVTLDHHLAGPVERARRTLSDELPGLTVALHCATQWRGNPAALERCLADIAAGDIILVTMLFTEEHFEPVLPALQARREACDALVVALSAGEVSRLTRMGRFVAGSGSSGPLALLKKLRGSAGKGGAKSTAGARQARMLSLLPRILRFVPGTAQDLRAFFLTMQYWLAGSDENVTNMIRLLVDRYADGPRRHLRGRLRVAAPVAHPDVGLYHPDLPGRLTDRIASLPRGGRGPAGSVGLLLMRGYVLAGDTAHYDGVIRALEERGVGAVPAYASGLDGRPAVERFFLDGDRSRVDAVISLTGFSLVGGPAYNDASAAEELLARLDVPYLAATATEFQTLEQWEVSERGLLPVEATMMVALPELDGAINPMLFAGRSIGAGEAGMREMKPHAERVRRLADRAAAMVRLRATPRDERRLAITLFNFPPNGGATGTAAFLAVFESLHRTLIALRAAGYRVEVPASVDALRERILEGNAARFGTDANVVARISADDHVRAEPHLAAIEAQWGAAPGRHQTDGSGILVLGERFGNVLVGIQPAFGYEGDPMRLLFERGFAPTHAFSAYYRYLRQDFAAHAVLHFGTHGALEFMPGKNVGLSAACWPDRLIGDLPNLYFYAANNPSEGTLAKRRSAATLISYLTPPIAQAGLYRGLLDLKASLDRFRALPPGAEERADLMDLVREQAAAADVAVPALPDDAARVDHLWRAVLELETTLIPHGMHVIGAPASPEERRDLLLAMLDTAGEGAIGPAAIEAIVSGATPEAALGAGAEPGALERLRELARTNELLSRDTELPALLHALDGGYVRPAPGGDLLRTPAILPTGRNVHGFDPFRLPSAFAVADGARQADRILARHQADGNALPETVAIVLWGTDTLKTEGAPVAQALALVGARPRFDSYGRLAGASLVPLAELGRPRIDVVATLSGIFRDLLPLQTRMLAEAMYLAASADEPVERNFVRAHALAYQERTGCDFETAALRIFSNADGTYGANVNHLIEASAWDDEDELAETYSRRKCFAYDRKGGSAAQPALLDAVLSSASLAYQNLESVELGVTTVDQYFDSLGGISRVIARTRGETVPVYVGDQTRGPGAVRTLSEQVALEARTRMLNPKWTEGMLRHGYEGVRQIEAHVTNTMGWSATTGQVQPWVYQQLTETYVLDKVMRERLAALNPKASVKVASRLIEAHERRYWAPDAATLQALREAGEALEDRLEGISEGIHP
ncbi:magnesium chelatase subunit H [Salinarimonas soli]|uniref:magnesium chelatase n=1 Tax=Salinarimonas soli TaxID=1638099 RepID=A0A5B2VHR2_9HYPH|nr:magnesium chelatase subunit H [Salinarimonas soli]KAA2238086.1 magnesium chelatase subunit H [Salinarimonas soli]